MKLEKDKIGRFIAELRNEKRLTQEELGEKLGINGKSVSKWENGLTAPSLSKLENLSQILGVSVNEIMNGKRIENEEKEFNNKTTVASINFYINFLKRKYIFIGLLIFIVIVFIFSFLFMISNYNKSKVFMISSLNSDYAINGYLIFNQNQNLLIINNINYQGNNRGTSNEPKIKEINIFVNNKEQNILSFSKLVEEKDNLLSEVLSKLSFSIDDSKKNNANVINYNTNLEDLILIIECKNEEDNILRFKIKLNFEEKFSNNKIMY